MGVKILMKIIFLMILIIIITSCVDENSNDFVEETIVEALLIVDEPIQNIRISKTIPILDTFTFESSAIKDANAFIYNENGDTFELIYDTELFNYKAINQSYLVEENQKYYLKIFYNGDTITGNTLTPRTFKWIQKAPDVIQFPKDSLTLSEVIKISWENPGSFNFYHIVVKCLDTLNYGAYLTPSTDELNRRISLIRDDEFYFNNSTNHGLSPLNEGSIIWTTFKWYGLQEVTIYNPDFNWFRWLGQYFQSEYNDILSTVEGKRARGVFGSAVAIRDTSFLLKNIQ